MRDSKNKNFGAQLVISHNHAIIYKMPITFYKLLFYINIQPNFNATTLLYIYKNSVGKTEIMWNIKAKIFKKWEIDCLYYRLDIILKQTTSCVTE